MYVYTHVCACILGITNGFLNRESESGVGVLRLFVGFHDNHTYLYITQSKKLSVKQSNTPRNLELELWKRLYL